MEKFTSKSTPEEIQEQADLDHVIAMSKYNYLGDEKIKEFKKIIDEKIKEFQEMVDAE